MSLKQFHSFISQLNTNSLFVIDTSYSKKDYVPLNLSVDNSELEDVNVSSSDDLGLFIEKSIKSQNGQVAFGGYKEVRGIYQRSSYFNEQVSPLDERNIHLGIDIWFDAGTNVLAALDAEVHSFNNNKNHGDYGPTIVLKHSMENFIFYTLYGHLSLESLDDIEIGQKFRQGELIAQLGSAEVNGDYPPHLHFQIILDIENYLGDYPGVASKNTLEFYENNCPDPNSLLGLNTKC
jgi:murein DD-endopeptidase MepM/ murein hydrolase activator NlpD